MAQVIIDSGNLTNIATAIRNKNGSAETYKPSEMAAAINAIETDPSLNDTVTSGDQILLGLTAHSKGTKYTGTIPTKTDSDITSVDGVVTIPAGYYAQQYTKQGDPTGDATLSSGAQMLKDVTAYAKGTKYTGTINTKAASDVTVTGQVYEEASGDYAWKTNITVPAGYFAEDTAIERTYSEIFPAPETEGTAGELLSGYELFNHEGKKIAGTMTNNSAVSATISSQGGSYTIPAGYHNGSGTVTANITAGTATTPATTQQQSQPTISVDANGLITANVAATSVSVTPSINPGYIDSGVAGTITMSANSATSQLSTQAAATITPKVTSQTGVASGKYTIGAVTVGPIYEEVSTSASMDSVLADNNNIGKMYLYTGTTDSKYTNGRYYICEEIPLSRVGGRIFYDNGDNGATYTFYDSSRNVISDTSISGLANAYYYTVSGTPSTDRFYVYDNSTHSVSDGTTTYSATDGLVSFIGWGYYQITTGATTNTIGSGKTNTSTVLAIEDTSSYNTNTIWKYIKALNDNSFNGCNDWFIASNAEQDQLRSSGLVSWYSSNYIWSSVESHYNLYAYYWDYNGSYWDDYYKDESDCGSCVRAF